MATVDHSGHHDAVGARLGMWLFLFTEILLFGGIFLLYSVYRSKFPEDFHYAATHLDIFTGTVNTAILLTSSLFMVLAVTSLEKHGRKLSASFIGLTMLMGTAFLVIKYFEWSSKISHGLFPNSKVLEIHTSGEKVFYSLYYLMTGLHALHIIIGLVILAVMFARISAKPSRKLEVAGGGTGILKITGTGPGTILDYRSDEPVSGIKLKLIYDHNKQIDEQDLITLENSGLYWHLVDVIWIFLFPLFYLIT
jgi:cytochrome c oxidase subunit 3